ncbi:MAG: hypothetical protein GY820_07945 [Gammaproteobacteria bacterium]|nr:hypothetical protein [Gammaproteobacteria bacterium]
MSAESLAPLSSIAEVISGYAFKSTWFGNGPDSVVRISDLVGGRVSLSNTVLFDADKYPVSDRYKIHSGDILVALSGATVGKIGVASKEVEGAYLNQRVAIVRGHGPGHADYLSFILRSNYMQRLLPSAEGAAQPNLSPKLLESLLIPIPPSEKQRQIAAHLKAQLAEVEKARQAVEVQLRDAMALKSKALETIFGSISNWKPIGSAAKLQSGYAFKSDTFKTSGIRLLRNANILPGKVYWDDAVFLSKQDSGKYPNYVLNNGDVLISLDRPIISSGIKVARVRADDVPALLVQRVGRFLIDPGKMDADYLYAYLQTEMFISEITGHDQSLGVPHISPIQIEGIEIPLPKVSVQRELSRRLKDISCEWETAASAIQLQQNDFSVLPRAILTQAFKP